MPRFLSILFKLLEKNEFSTTQLLKSVPLIVEYSDEGGRRMLHEALQDVLMKVTDIDEQIAPVMAVLRQISMDEAHFNSHVIIFFGLIVCRTITSVISNLLEPIFFASSDETAQIIYQLEQKFEELCLEIEEKKKKLKTLKKSDRKEIDITKKEIEELEQEASDIDKKETARIEMFEQIWLIVLTIVEQLLCTTYCGFSDPTLFALKDEVIRKALMFEQPTVRRKAIACLGLYTMLEGV